MENKTQVSSSSSASSPTTSSLAHLFGPKDSNSSSSTGIFSTIFPPPPTVLGRCSSQSGMRKHGMSQTGNKTYDARGSKGESSGKDLYEDETVEPCNLSSSIYYGGQENYSPRTKINNSDDQSHHKNTKDGKDDDHNNGSNSNTASRGNWWQGSLYY